MIRDRNRPVAKLMLFVAEGATDEELALVAAGVLRLPVKRTNLKAFFKMPIARMNDAAEQSCGAT